MLQRILLTSSRSYIFVEMGYLRHPKNAMMVQISEVMGVQVIAPLKRATSVRAHYAIQVNAMNLKILSLPSQLNHLGLM